MSGHGSEEPERVEIEDEIARHWVTTGLRVLLGAPEFWPLGGNPGDLKDWLASIGQGQFIYVREGNCLFGIYRNKGTGLKIYWGSRGEGSSVELDRIRGGDW